MRQFNLEEYFKNPKRKVITRNGEDVRIICTDKKDAVRPLIALITQDDGTEYLQTYLPDGRISEAINYIDDLFFAPKKKEGWINVYSDEDKYKLGATYFYHSEQEAKANVAVTGGLYKYVATVKIEWEE